MTTSKSPRRVLRVAFDAARAALPAYRHKFSPKKFTQPQLFACLTVKEMLKRSYRSGEALLADCDNWLRDVGLSKAPDHNTLCRAHKELVKPGVVERMMDVSVAKARDLQRRHRRNKKKKGPKKT